MSTVLSLLCALVFFFSRNRWKNSADVDHMTPSSFIRNATLVEPNILFLVNWTWISNLRLPDHRELMCIMWTSEDKETLRPIDKLVSLSSVWRHRHLERKTHLYPGSIWVCLLSKALTGSYHLMISLGLSVSEPTTQYSNILIKSWARKEKVSVTALNRCASLTYLQRAW